MKTAVMTDSNSGITPEEGKKIGIYSLPMPVIIEGDVFYEGKNITQEEYYGAMTSGKNVTTSHIYNHSFQSHLSRFQTRFS